MKNPLSILVVIAFCVGLAATAQSQESKTQAKLLVYTGKITKIEKPDLIAVETNESVMEFHLKHDGGKDCVPIQELSVGDNVTVSCKEKKDRMEARCVKKIPVGTRMRGVTMQGVTVK
jgi:hypothetical protein